MSKAKAWTTDDDTPLPERVLAELEAAEINPGRPVIAVDADEVLVHFAAHFNGFLTARGYRFSLSEYRLDNAIFDAAGKALTRERITPLIWDFIGGETSRQPVIEGAAEALASLESEGQVIVLTNAPDSVRADRIANLADHGMNYPVVMNEGGKGRALRWIAQRAAAPVAFVDDSVAQHASAAKHAPAVMRFHMVAPEILRPVMAKAPGARRVESWAEATPLIRRALAHGV